MVVADKINKASADAQYDPLGALYSLLEHYTAKNFTDEFAEGAIDATQVMWITTANDKRAIPDSILNRMNIYQLAAPSTETARAIDRNLYQGLRHAHGWGNHFLPEPQPDVLGHMSALAPREMRRA